MEVDRLLRTEPHEPTANHLRSVVEGPVLLYIGPIGPSRRIDRLIEAFNILVTHHRPDAQLIVASTGGSASYSRVLLRQLLELNLSNAWLLEAADDGQVVALLERAVLLVTLADADDGDDAEGEADAGTLLSVAFAYGIPAVARGVGALSTLASGAALLLDPDDGIEVAAEAFLEVLTNGRLRAELVERGRRRAVELDLPLAPPRRVEPVTTAPAPVQAAT